jgi:tripartite-type tricarboxylate transporter receptor subunit TctC
MTSCIRNLITLACLGLGLLPAQAQTYPAKPVRIVVPFAAGGATDVIARAIGQRLGEAWGQQVIVENKPGANTQLGAADVAKAAPDGYTLLATAEGTFVTNPVLYAKLPYDPVKDFVPVSGLGLITQVLVVNPAAPMRTVADLVALARTKPGELNYGTFGIGSASHLNMAMFEGMAGIKLAPVHYRGGAPAVTDVIGGHIPMLFVSVTLMAQPFKTGQLRALGVGGAKRLAQFPDLPTIAESGLPGFQAVSWFGLFAPAGTPNPIVAKVNADVQQILASAAFRQQFLDPNFYEPIPGTPEQFAEYVRTDAARWANALKDTTIKID